MKSLYVARIPSQPGSRLALAVGCMHIPYVHNEHLLGFSNKNPEEGV